MPTEKQIADKIEDFLDPDSPSEAAMDVLFNDDDFIKSLRDMLGLYSRKVSQDDDKWRAIAMREHKANNVILAAEKTLRDLAIIDIEERAKQPHMSRRSFPFAPLRFAQSPRVK